MKHPEKGTYAPTHPEGGGEPRELLSSAMKEQKTIAEHQWGVNPSGGENGKAHLLICQARVGLGERRGSAKEWPKPCLNSRATRKGEGRKEGRVGGKVAIIFQDGGRARSSERREVKLQAQKAVTRAGKTEEGRTNETPVSQPWEGEKLSSHSTRRKRGVNSRVLSAGVEFAEGNWGETRQRSPGKRQGSSSSCLG